MVRSYEVNVCIDAKIAGFWLSCYEDDGVVYERFFRDSSDAHACGTAYLDGAFVSLMYEDVAA